MRYAAFFRGLNVGGKHKVKMADLKQLFEDSGFGGVKTYIQSGNVIFESGRDARLLPGMIAIAFAERFLFRTPVVVRSAAEIAAIVSALPFTDAEIARAEAANPDVAHVYYYLCDNAIDPAAAQALRASYHGDDRFAAGERELYLLCMQSIRDSRLAASLMKLDETLTVRNHKTMQTILQLLDTQA